MAPSPFSDKELIFDTHRKLTTAIDDYTKITMTIYLIDLGTIDNDNSSTWVRLAERL